MFVGSYKTLKKKLTEQATQLRMCRDCHTRDVVQVCLFQVYFVRHSFRPNSGARALAHQRSTIAKEIW